MTRENGPTGPAQGWYRAITISQPYATLIASGEKWIENRTWAPKYRGLLAIHAGKGVQYLRRADVDTYPTGVLAVVNLVMCFRMADVDQVVDELRRFGLSVEQIRAHKHAVGPWCWLFRDVRKLRVPVPCRGAQNLWKWVPEEPVEFVGG